MNKSILVLDENSVVHGLIASALDIDGLTLHHEFNPNRFVARAQETRPDLILLSNTDGKAGYRVCRNLKGAQTTAGVPLVLLANSSDALSAQILDDLGVDGVIRKPFEASDLQMQVSKHLNLIDLVGSAYEYRKSQSMRDDDSNPLAAIDVLDSEVLGMLRPATGTEVGVDVPEVDFSEDLSTENTRIDMDESALANELQPENVFETLSPADAGHPGGTSVGGAAEMSRGGLSFSEEEALERLGTEGGLAAEIEELSPADLLDDEPLEELDAADVLDEEHAGESAGPAGFDQVLGDEAYADEEFVLGDETLDEGWDEAPDVADTDAGPEELAEPELLEEEAPGEFTGPSAFDQSLEDDADTREQELLPLDEIQIELSEAEVDHDAALEEILGEDEDDAALFEADMEDSLMLDEEPPDAEAPQQRSAYKSPRKDSEDIPPTVRRMMDLKPVFSMTPEERARELDAEFHAPGDAKPQVFEPSEEELDRMADELGSIDEMELELDATLVDEDAEEEWREPEEMPQMDIPAVHMMDESVPDGASDGVESEVDEQRILEALEADAAAGLGEGEFAEELDDASLIVDEDVSLEHIELGADTLDDSLEGMEEEPEDDLEDIAIDLDEETLVMSSLEDEELSQDAFSYESPAGEVHAQAGEESDELPPLEDEVFPSGEAPGHRLSISNIPEAEQLPTDDDVLPPLRDDELELASLTPEEEAALEHDARILEGGEIVFHVPEDELLEVPPDTGKHPLGDDELSLEDEHLLSLEAETMEELEDLEESLSDLSEGEDEDEFDLGEEQELTPVAESEDWTVSDLEPVGDLGLQDAEEREEELEQAYLQDDLSLAEEDELSADAGEAAAAEADAQGDDAGEGLGDDFMDDLMALQEEFKAGPGERLSDILKAEAIQTAAEEIEFELPQQETTFTRVMGIEALPDDGAAQTADEEAPALQGPDDLASRFTDEVLSVGDVGLETLAGLDTQLRARLGEILDEMIAVSVRKAIQEEMPKLLQQMEEDTNRT